MVHLGASARYRNFDNDTFGSEVTYSQRPFDGAITQVFNARDTEAATTGSESVIYGGVRAQVDW